MFKSLPLFVLGLAALAAPAVVADDDDLFSDVRVDSVYESESDSGTPRKRATVRVNDTDELNQLVREAGFEPKSAGGRGVATTKRIEPLSFPVLISLTEDEKHLGILLVLSTLNDEDQVTTEQLLKLMDANRKYAPSQFSFSTAKKQTELFFLLPNENLTGESLRDEINRLAILAKQTESIWRIGAADTAETSTENTVEEPIRQQQLKSNTVTPATRLKGRWSAARSTTEAFAIQFNDDGTFVLVYIKDGKQTRSSGKFTGTDSQLTLDGSDGLKLSGKFVSKSDTEFQFQPQNSTAALTFTKAP